MMNPVSARLLNQQLICPQFNEPAEVVSWFGAMQAQDARSMRWAVAMRTQKPSLRAFDGAFNAGRIIRAHLLRCTWQLVTAEDYHWIRQLIYKKGLGVMNGWTSALGWLARKYFQSHGPATLEDFAWWSGLNLGDCRRGIDALGDGLVTERWKGMEFISMAIIVNR